MDSITNTTDSITNISKKIECIETDIREINAKLDLILSLLTVKLPERTHV